MAEPPDKAPVVNAVQFQPEGGAVKGANELFGLNFAQVEHPSPGALTKDDTCSMDVPVNKLHNHGTSNEYDTKAWMKEAGLESAEAEEAVQAVSYTHLRAHET